MEITLSRLKFLIIPRLLLFASAISIVQAQAQAPDPDTLTIEDTAGKATATYTIESLRKEYVLQERTTATPWSGLGTIEFRGPLLKDILAKNGIAGAREFEVLAYNDFISRISAVEIDAYSPILAIEQRCTDEDRSRSLCEANQTYRPLSVDDGGPFYLVWPLKNRPRNYVPGRNAIWVWFVVKVRPI
jgi:hypothetical protein